MPIRLIPSPPLEAFGQKLVPHSLSLRAFFLFISQTSSCSGVPCSTFQPYEFVSPFI